VQVGPAPVEGAALLCEAARARGSCLAEALLDAAAAALVEPGISVVEPALRAAALGATALHDPTEGGLACGLHELAEASGVGLRVEEANVIWFEPGVAVCEALGADPWGTLASGALLAAFPEAEAEAAVRSLAVDGVRAAIVARADGGGGVRRSNGAPLRRFDRDEVARVLSSGG
jgi:hydrogenase maturation factor